MLKHDQVDTSQVRRTLGLFCTTPNQVVEIRAILPGGKVLSGYFDDLDSATDWVARIPKQATGIYFTPNRLKHAVLARARNRMRDFYSSKPTTSDGDVLRRAWLLIDIDPVRPSGISSTDKEHSLAISRAKAVRAYLRSTLRLPEPILADSGNGGHAAFRIDLPNTLESTQLIQRVLMGIDHEFTDDRVKIDLTTYNAARIWRLYGTYARKGDHTTERPHRRSQILEVPGA